MKTKYTVEECPVCKQQVKRAHDRDTRGVKVSHLVRHLKDGMPCIKGAMTLSDVMIGNQYTGVTQ